MAFRVMLWMCVACLMVLPIKNVVNAAAHSTHCMPHRCPHARIQARPRLVFEVSEGFPNNLVQSTRSETAAGDFSTLEVQLDNIYDALLPLTDHYDVSVLLYPTFLYNATATAYKENPLNKIHPGLHYFMEYFNKSDIGVFLELYSSGIMTQQIGPRGGTLPPTPLINSTSKPGYIGLSMDMETVTALKQAYKKSFVGVRFHEVYGCDSVWRSDGQTDCFQMSPDVFEAVIDTCSHTGLIYHHNDNSHLLQHSMGNTPWSYNASSPAYYTAKLMKNNSTSTVDYAVKMLGRRALFSYENNNGFPTPDLAYFDSVVNPSNSSFPLSSWETWHWPCHQFPLRGNGGSWGISNQPWAWSEWVHTLTRVPYWPHNEMSSPVEFLQQFSSYALNNSVDILQFEPSWYFFDEYFPKSNSQSALQAPPDLTLSGFPTHSGRLALTRLKSVLLQSVDPNPQVHQESMPSPDLRAQFDGDQQLFLKNTVRAAPLNYRQQSMFWFSDNKFNAMSFYSDGRRWISHAEDVILPAAISLFAESINGIELTGDGVDEFMVQYKNITHTTLRFFGAWGGDLGNPIAFATSVSGCGIASISAGNYVVDKVNRGGDPDEILVMRNCAQPQTKLYEIWNMNDYDWHEDIHFTYVRMNKTFESKVLSELFGVQSFAADYIGSIVRHGVGVIYPQTVTRGLDTSWTFTLINTSLPPKDCGRKGLGASGPWLGTINNCNSSCICQSHCQSQNLCAAWQFIIDPSSKDYRSCYLKSTVEMEPNSDSVSGAIDMKASICGPQCKLRVATDNIFLDVSFSHYIDASTSPYDVHAVSIDVDGDHSEELLIFNRHTNQFDVFGVASGILAFRFSHSFNFSTNLRSTGTRRQLIQTDGTV